MQVLMLAILTGCWEKKVKNLSDVEFDHYYALRVYMEEEQRKTYLKMKTEDERNAYLQQLGLWDRFYDYEPHIREKIVAGEVQTGWTKDMLYRPGAPPTTAPAWWVGRPFVPRCSPTGSRSRRTAPFCCGSRAARPSTRRCVSSSARLSLMTTTSSRSAKRAPPGRG